MVLAFSIIAINMVFYQIIIPLVKMIGLLTTNREEVLSCRLIVLCLLLDMLMLPIFIGMNLKEWGWLKGSFNG